MNLLRSTRGEEVVMIQKNKGLQDLLHADAIASVIDALRVDMLFALLTGFDHSPAFEGEFSSAVPELFSELLNFSNHLFFGDSIGNLDLVGEVSGALRNFAESVVLFLGHCKLKINNGKKDSRSYGLWLSAGLSTCNTLEPPRSHDGNSFLAGID